MGTTKGRSANGLGMAQSPAVHQNICRQLIEGLTKKLKANFKRNVSYETAIDGFVNKEEIAPDVVFFKDTYYPKGSKKLKSENPIFLIEVVKSDGVEYSTGNIERVFKRCPSLKEAFLYNYETERSCFRHWDTQNFIFLRLQVCRADFVPRPCQAELFS